MGDQKKNRLRRNGWMVLVPAILFFLCWQYPAVTGRGIASANPMGKGDHAMTMTLSSSAFVANGKIPALHTCDGQDLSPPLRFSGVPPSCKSLALIVDDPDAPDPAAPKMTWVHWLLYNLSASATGLAGGASRSLLPGTLEGLNDWKRTGYGGPCPPVGTHRYFFKLCALDVVLPDLGKPDKKRLLKAMEGHVVGEAQLVGSYHR